MHVLSPANCSNQTDTAAAGKARSSMVARTVRGSTSADVVDERSRWRAPRSETRWRSDARSQVQSHGASNTLYSTASRCRGRITSRQLRYIRLWISRRPLKIEAWSQRTTNRKWYMEYQMITWTMTSRDPETWSTVGYPNDSVASCSIQFNLFQ